MVNAYEMRKIFAHCSDFCSERKSVGGSKNNIKSVSKLAEILYVCYVVTEQKRHRNGPRKLSFFLAQFDSCFAPCRRLVAVVSRRHVELKQEKGRYRRQQSGRSCTAAAAVEAINNKRRLAAPVTS